MPLSSSLSLLPRKSNRFSLSVTLVLLLLTHSHTSTAKRGCSAFGHSCFGGHGKRAEAPAQLQLPSGEESAMSPEDEIPPRGARLPPRAPLFLTDDELLQIRLSPLFRTLIPRPSQISRRHSAADLQRDLSQV